MTIDEAFKKSAEFHGHECPGLAIGVRAAYEAIRLFGIDNNKDKEFSCIAESKACYIDAIQVLCGCTMGKRNLEFRYTGKTAFSFYHPTLGKSVRFLLKDGEQPAGKQEKIAYLLHAPLSDVFDIGDAHVPYPDFVPGSRQSCRCSVCGEPAVESTMRVKDGKPVCLECAGVI